MATKLNTLNLLALPNLVTPPSGFVSFGAKSDGLYQKVGSTERRLATINDTVASANTAAKLATSRTISLTGDASGSTSFDGSANVSIAVTVADDSHNHVIANIDGLQVALDGKSPTSHTHTFASLTSKPTTLSGYGITDAVNVSEVVTTAIANKILKLNSSAQLPASITGNAATATKLQTPRTIAGVSFDGTANIAIPFANLSSKPTTLAGYGITDAYTKTEVNSALNLKLDKSVFDDLFEKVEVSAGVFAIKAKYNFYGVGEVSSYGIGSGGSSGGGSYDRLDAWADYDSSKSGWVLSALLGVDLNNRLSNVEGGSATSVSVTGTGDVLTNVTKSGNNLNFTRGNQTWANLSGKPATFTPSAHNHPISDITGLQAALNAKEGTITAGTTAQYWRGDKSWQTLNTTVVPEGTNLYYTNARVKAYADTLYSPLGHTHTISDITNLQTTLNSKLETSIFNTHNNDNVRHITGAERTKWNGVVADFGNLEIGGRNLITNTKQELHTDNSSGQEQVQLSTFPKSFEFTRNSEYVFSFDLKGSGQVKFVIGNYSYPVSTVASNGAVGSDNGGLLYFTATGEWNRGWVKIKTGNWGIEKVSKPINLFVQAGSDIYIREIKLEKGNKATDWTPAPEDQVSDWNTTDVNSFSFIKNKPTTLSGYGITDAMTLNTAQTITGEKTFTSNLQVNRTDLTLEAENLMIRFGIGGYSSAGGIYGVVDKRSPEGFGVLIKTYRQNYGVYNAVKISHDGNVGIGIDSPTQKLHVGGNILATGTTTTTKVIFNAAGWSMEQVGSELQMKHNNVLKMRFTSAGSIIATEEITAFG